jgi:hypothetical protein
MSESRTSYSVPFKFTLCSLFFWPAGSVATPLPPHFLVAPCAGGQALRVRVPARPGGRLRVGLGVTGSASGAHPEAELLF